MVQPCILAEVDRRVVVVVVAIVVVVVVVVVVIVAAVAAAAVAVVVVGVGEPATADSYDAFHCAAFWYHTAQAPAPSNSASVEVIERAETADACATLEFRRLCTGPGGLFKGLICAR